MEEKFRKRIFDICAGPDLEKINGEARKALERAAAELLREIEPVVDDYVAEYYSLESTMKREQERLRRAQDTSREIHGASINEPESRFTL